MYIQPFTDDELDDNYLAEGDAMGVVETSTIVKSKTSSNYLLVMTNTIWDVNQKEGIIKNHITLIDSCRWQLKQLFKAIGKIEELKKGFEVDNLPFLIEKCAFNCFIGKSNPKEDGKKYMEIKYYKECDHSKLDVFSEKNNNKASQDFFGDDIKL